MGQEALVNGKDAFGSNRLAQAVEDALVQVSVLVIHAGHDGICGTMLVVGSSSNAARYNTYQEDA